MGGRLAFALAVLIAISVPVGGKAAEEGPARAIVSDALEIGTRLCAEAFGDAAAIGANLSAAGARSVPLDYFGMQGRTDGVVGSYSLELNGEEFGVLVFRQDRCQVMIRSRAVITANTELRKLVEETYSGRCTDAHSQHDDSKRVLFNRRFCSLDGALEDGRATVILSLLILGPGIAAMITQFAPLEPEGVEEILTNQEAFFGLNVGLD